MANVKNQHIAGRLPAGGQSQLDPDPNDFLIFSMLLFLSLNSTSIRWFPFLASDKLLHWDDDDCDNDEENDKIEDDFDDTGEPPTVGAEQDPVPKHRQVLWKH